MDKNVILNEVAAYFETLATYNPKTTEFALSPPDYSDLIAFIDRHYTDGIESISSARVNDDGSILCVGMDGDKQVAVKITDNNVEIRLLNDESAAFKIGTAGALPTKKKCTAKGLSCGGTCISRSKTCISKLSPEDKSMLDSLRKKIKSITGKTATKDAAPQDANSRRLQALKDFKPADHKDIGKAASQLFEKEYFGIQKSSKDEKVSAEADNHMEGIYKKLSDTQKDDLARQWIRKTKGKEVGNEIEKIRPLFDRIEETDGKKHQWLLDISNRVLKMSHGSEAENLKKYSDQRANTFILQRPDDN